uniref:FlgN protein n=1 Tax=uncultured bacterium contig00062 TaxID=1181545 RepID=A0A806K151_9BACT|nr:hypothetical protein [uncultured bacterium contig00062]
MKETWSFDYCVTVLTGEIGLLKKILAAQDKVRQLVMNREWADFDEKTAEVNRLGEEFALLEEERARLFYALSEVAHLNGSSVAWTIEARPFYASILALPVEERQELSRLYRELKMETLKMRALNETFLAYLNEAKNLAAAYLEAVCPARGGKLYTRKGGRASQDLKSIVFNNRF